jgi:hypothetical protein
MNEQQRGQAIRSSWAWTDRCQRRPRLSGPYGRPNSPPGSRPSSSGNYPTMAGGHALAPMTGTEETSLEDICAKTITEAVSDAVDRAGTVPVGTTGRDGGPARVLVDAAKGANLLIVGAGATADSPASSWARSAQHCAQCALPDRHRSRPQPALKTGA